MISKRELKKIATARLKDAEALFIAKRYDGAMYLCGYAIELSIKLRICKTLNWSAFPESNAEFRDLLSFKTHDFNVLLRLSGIEEKIKLNYFVEWSIVQKWKPELRYSKITSASITSTAQMISATKTILTLL